MQKPKGMYTRGNQWWVRKVVPPELRAFIGKRELKDSLHTTGLREAIPRAHRLLADYEEQLNRARMSPQPTRSDGPRYIIQDSSGTTVTGGPSAPAPPMPTLRGVFERWVDQRAPTTNTVNETRRNMNTFIELNGDRVMRGFSVEHARAWRDFIMKVDSAHGTKLKRFNAVTNLFKFAWKQDDLIEENPFKRVSLERPRRDRAARRLEWSLDDLRKWFNSPVYTEGYRPKYGDAAYWLPILGLFHGARLGELCQMDRTDIKWDGVPRMMIRPSDEDEDDEEAKSVKTEESIRKVPLHHRVIELGFLDYFNTLDGTKLFPRVRPDSRGRWSGRFSNWFGEYRRKLGITERWLDYHALRGTWKSGARGVKIDPRVHDAITGHSGSVADKHYGSYPDLVLKEAVDKVDFDVVIPRWVSPSG
jgi:integrase